MKLPYRPLIVLIGLPLIIPYRPLSDLSPYPTGFPWSASTLITLVHFSGIFYRVLLAMIYPSGYISVLAAGSL